ncbi:hypothetical protein K502DRAFT_354923 [Neoconidiobolus thromboides FSU 785]|nr:hypothetical protein K502DRAFT_354923 [Neoconidiobolus thromboides FSU 785]
MVYKNRIIIYIKKIQKDLERFRQHPIKLSDSEKAMEDRNVDTVSITGLSLYHVNISILYENNNYHETIENIDQLVHVFKDIISMKKTIIIQYHISNLRYLEQY